MEVVPWLIPNLPDPGALRRRLLPPARRQWLNLNRRPLQLAGPAFPGGSFPGSGSWDCC